uniref:Putative cpij001872 odorant-binding protein 56a n=1 Tax=Aedes albopictus TaxID=7160 RepID=A0A023EG24_AEDAL
MNLFVLFFNVACLAACWAGYTDNQWNQLQLKSEKCRKQLQLPEDSDIPARAHRGDVTMATELFKKFVHCESSSMGFVDENGLPIKKTLVDFMTEGHNNTLVQELVDRCAGGDLGEQPHERAFNYYKCFWTQKKFEV